MTGTTERPPLRFGVMYDCRRHPDGDATMAEVYRRTVDQAVLADSLGFDNVWFTEHHFCADGYLPAFQPRKRYRLTDVDVHPKPVQAGGPPLWIAAMSEAGAMRAARFGTNLLPQGRRSEVLDPWRASVTERGAEPDAFRVGIIRSTYVTDDRERDWPAIRKAERYRMSIYDEFMAETPDTYAWGDADAIPQSVIVGTASECVDQLRGFIDTFGITDIATSGLPPGVDLDWANRNIERLATEVIPQL